MQVWRAGMDVKFARYPSVKHLLRISKGLIAAYVELAHLDVARCQAGVTREPRRCFDGRHLGPAAV
jgi:hypothetical protein